MRKKERERDRGGLTEREGLRKSVCYTSFPLSLSLTHTHPELNVNGVSLSLSSFTFLSYFVTFVERPVLH
jgi:hypothetical protein